MSIDDLWYKNAIIYCLEVEKFQDANGDGGRLRGLMRRLDYLAGIGATRLWLQPISWGDFVVLRTSAPDVLALRFDWRGTSLVTLSNFAGGRRRVERSIESRLAPSTWSRASEHLRRREPVLSRPAPAARGAGPSRSPQS
jgi:hypothetical protein